MKQTRKPRPDMPGTNASDDVGAMIRVDHAGEFGALRIYQGQLAVLSRDKRARTDTQAIRHMAAQEQTHFDAFAKLMAARRVRPTALSPLWHIAGYALGATTALMGEKAAMACTVAVEDVIDEHYAGQAERLGDSDPELKALIENFRADENQHRSEALARGAEQAPAYAALTDVIRAGCRLAIKLSERF